MFLIFVWKSRKFVIDNDYMKRLKIKNYLCFNRYLTIEMKETRPQTIAKQLREWASSVMRLQMFQEMSIARSLSESESKRSNNSLMARKLYIQAAIRDHWEVYEFISQEEKMCSTASISQINAFPYFNVLCYLSI